MHNITLTLNSIKATSYQIVLGQIRWRDFCIRLNLIQSKLSACVVVLALYCFLDLNRRFKAPSAEYSSLLSTTVLTMMVSLQRFDMMAVNI